MPKDKLRALAVDFLYNAKKYEFSIGNFLYLNKILGDELILEQILEEITKIYYKQIVAKRGN